MEFIKQWTMNIVYVSVLIAFVKTLLPEGRIRKTVLTAAGLIMLYTISAPIASLLNSNIKESFKFPEFAIETEKENGTSDNSAYFDNGSVTGIYKQKIEEQVRKAIEGEPEIAEVKAIVNVEEDSGSAEYGFIRSVKINLKLKKNKKEGDSEKVFPTGQGRIIVNIDKIGGENTAKIVNEENIVTNSGLKEKIIKKVSSLLDISEGIVSVSYV